MSYLQGALLDELERNRRMQEAFTNKNDMLLHGSISIKKEKYVYINYKKNGKYISHYCGIFSPELISSLRKQNKEFKENKNALKQAKKEEKQILRAIEAFND